MQKLTAFMPAFEDIDVSQLCRFYCTCDPACSPSVQSCMTASCVQCFCMLLSKRQSYVLQVIKRFIMHAKKTAFIVEHDFIMATYLADRVIVYDGEPSRRATARKPQGLLTGMNAFLKTLDITFRRDPTNYRPRINKAESTKDREQKLAGTFYYLDD